MCLIKLGMCVDPTYLLLTREFRRSLLGIDVQPIFGKGPDNLNAASLNPQTSRCQK